MKPLIWLVEDEPSIADTLIYTLESEGLPSGGLTGGNPLWLLWPMARQHWQ